MQVPSGHSCPLGDGRIVQNLNRLSHDQQAATVDGIQDEVQRIAIGTDHPMPHVIPFLNDKVSHKSLARFAAHLALGRTRNGSAETPAEPFMDRTQINLFQMRVIDESGQSRNR